MRILRLDLSDGRGTVDLHPFISIVQGLGPVEADELVASIRSLVRGTPTGSGGLVESGGELVELRGDGTDPVGPLTIEDVFVDLGATAFSGDPVVLRAELDQLQRRATIDAVLLEEVRADFDPAAAARVQRLHQALAAFDGDDPGEQQAIEAVKAAVVAARSIDPIRREMPEDVAEILGEWEIYEQARAAAQPELDALAQRVQELMAERETANQHLAEAMTTTVPVVLTTEEDQRVEELALAATNTKKNKRPSDAELAELQSLLAKVGQTSYVAYVMYRMAPEPSAESLAAVEAARERIAVVDQRLEQARHELQYGEVNSSLTAILESVKETARRHLGPMLPSDLGTALRAQVIESENPDYVEALKALDETLLDHGIELPEDLDIPGLLPWSERWVIEAERPKVQVGPSRVELLGQLATAEASFDRHARSMARIDRLETMAVESAKRAAEVSEQLRLGEGNAGNSADQAVALLRPLADRVRSEAGASVPLVLKGEFDDLESSELFDLLDQLEVLAQDLQLVVISDNAQALEWASAAGLRRALGSTISPETV